MRESRRDALLLAVAGHVHAADDAGAVLGADRHRRDLVDFRRHDRLEHLQLLVAHAVGVKRGRRLHRQQRQQLQHVVLNEIAQRAGALVVAGTPLDPDVLGGSDLNLVDVVAVPDRLEQRVGEPQRHQVLDRLLAQVVVDPEDLRLLEHLEQLGIELAGGREVVAERLLDHDPDVRAGRPCRARRRRACRRSAGRTPARSTGRRRDRARRPPARRTRSASVPSSA